MTNRRNRKITMELAERFATVLASDIAHSMDSAAHAVRLNPTTVRGAIGRFERDECETEEDDAICEVLAAARAMHILSLRRGGEGACADKNAPGVAWYKWRLETQAPKEHPRKEQVEVTGLNGGPVAVAPISRAEALEELRKLAKDDPEIALALKGQE